MQIEVRGDVDETDVPEEFSRDLYPLVDTSTTLHLDEWGLPKVGTRIEAGMIVVGKIARTRSYDPGIRPTALEKYGLGWRAVRRKYGHMWRDTSLYADETHSGVVMEAALVRRGGSTVALVRIEKGATPPHRPADGPPSR